MLPPKSLHFLARNSSKLVKILSPMGKEQHSCEVYAQFGDSEPPHPIEFATDQFLWQSLAYPLVLKYSILR